jgi:hypothetical protein
MTELETLKQELKKVNAEYAGIRDVPVEKRAEFGRKINARKQEIVAKIAAAEKTAMDVDVTPIDVTAPTAPNAATAAIPPAVAAPITELTRISLAEPPDAAVPHPANTPPTTAETAIPIIARPESTAKSPVGSDFITGLLLQYANIL